MIYDFGGQDYYHGLYQAFLSEDSINLLLWCKQTNKNEVDKEKSIRNFTREYWIYQLVYAFKKRKNEHDKTNTTEPVLLVQTYADMDKRMNFVEDVSDCSIINEFYISLNKIAVEGENGKAGKEAFRLGLKYLKAYLLQEIEEKREEKYESEYYQEFLEYILKSSAKCFNIEELKKACYKRKRHDWEKEADLLTHLKVELGKLYQKGLVLYYRYNEKLKDKVWLNPAETVKNIYETVLSKENMTACKGHVPEKVFDELCRTDEDIKELLKAEKVIFFEKDKKEYIIPGYLPLSDDDEYYEILKFGFVKPNFTLKFRNFIPFGLINELICEFGKNPDYKKFWRDQLIFTYHGSYKIWIKLDFSQLTIAVYISQTQEPNLKQKEVEKTVFLNIIDLYWGKELRSREDKSGKREAAETGKINSPIDMYLSLDEKQYIHHIKIEEMPEYQDKIPAYTFEEGKMLPGKTQPVYKYRNFSNNDKLKRMKKIFISYSRKDVDYKEELKKHLIPLQLFDIADNWSCEEISIGKWDEQIQKELEESDLIIYMLSANFFSSKYILEKEVQKGMDLVLENPDKKILCVIVSDFVGLDKLKSATKEQDLNPLQEAVLKLNEWQYLPYGDVLNKVTDKPEEKIIPLNKYRPVEEALTQIGKKILDMWR
jgi:internalin A